MTPDENAIFLRGWHEGYRAAERDRLEQPGSELIDTLVVKRIGQLLARLRTAEQAEAAEAQQDREAARGRAGA